MNVRRIPMTSTGSVIGIRRTVTYRFGVDHPFGQSCQVLRSSKVAPSTYSNLTVRYRTENLFWVTLTKIAR